VNSAGAVFNIEKLNWMNAEYIKQYDIDKLTELVIPYLNAGRIDTSDTAKTKRVVIAIRNYINKLDESAGQAGIYYKKTEMDASQREISGTEASKQIFKNLILKVESLLEITMDNFKPIVSEVQKETGIKGKNLFMPLRIALTGEEHGPELGLIAFVLGKEEVLKRLKQVNQ
jgi:glutamyl/glutaminyl-tRNA synthetase